MSEHKAKITLRAATRSDVPLIRRFIEALAEYEKLSHECVATDARLERTLFGDQPEAEVVLAFVDDEPAGLALFFRSYSTFLARSGIYLEDLFVEPHLRGQGVGRALLAHLANLAVQSGGQRLEWSVLNWNTDAIRFYESLGAQGRSEWTVYRLSGDDLESLAREHAVHP